MINPWALSIIVMALAVLAASWHLPRARLWVTIGMASFFASSLVWDLGYRQLHPVFTLTCDALVCLCLYRKAIEIWELGVFAAFLLSVFSSFFMIAGFVPSSVVYASLLEVCNYAALLCIGGTGLLERYARHEGTLLGDLRRDLRCAYHSFR